MDRLPPAQQPDPQRQGVLRQERAKAEQCDAANAEHLERDAANVAWLGESFAQARARNARGLVLVFQGDPGFDLPETDDLDESAAKGYLVIATS